MGPLLPSGTPSTAEYDVSADLTVKSNVGATGVVARASTSGSDNFYVARYNAAGANGASWEILLCNPTCTVKGFFAQTLGVEASSLARAPRDVGALTVQNL